MVCESTGTGGIPGTIVCASANDGPLADGEPGGIVIASPNGGGVFTTEEADGPSAGVKPGRMVGASPNGSGVFTAEGGGGVWTPAAVVLARLVLHRGQLFAEAGNSLPQRLQTIDNHAFTGGAGSVR